jgi:sporulation protein YlmC with PRC-barrel domain
MITSLIIEENNMKKLATILITGVSMLALTSPLYAAGDMTKSADPKQKADTAQTMPAYPKQKADTAQTMSADPKQKAAVVQTLSADPKQKVGAAQSMSAEELEGIQVYSQAGEEIGEIKGVTIDDTSGTVKFVNLSKGGILGIGAEDIAVPLEALNFEDGRAVLAVDISKLENAPKQAEMSDKDFQSELQSHYGVSPAWQQDAVRPIEMKEVKPMDENPPKSTN